MRRAIRVYVAGPYSRGDVGLNIHEAIEWGERIFCAGFVPYVPHLNHLWHIQRPHGYEDWLAMDLAWLDCCDCLFRFPGESPGAEREIARAREYGMPVFYSINEMREWYSREEADE